MKKWIRNSLSICLLFFTFILNAQTNEKYNISDADYDNTSIEMADKMRENGKIYVVVIVLLIIWAGLFGYILFTERKLNRLEKLLKEN